MRRSASVWSRIDQNEIRAKLVDLFKKLRGSRDELTRGKSSAKEGWACGRGLWRAYLVRAKWRGVAD